MSRSLQARAERTTDLASRAGDENLHASEIRDRVVDHRGAAAQEVEVAPFVGLEDVVHVQPSKSALVLPRRWLPAGAALLQLAVRDEQVETPLGDVETDEVTVTNEASGPPTADSGATCRTTAP